jgi:Flp pilus assembly protein TadG
VIVEFALVIPILMLLLLALADFALAELSDAAGSNAAREGARVGILYYDGAAGTTGSTNANYLKISAAVSDKLADNVQGTPAVTVRCLNPDGTPRPSSGSCSTVGTGEVQVGVGGDLIEVSVRWQRKGGITGFIGNSARTDKAVMRIVGTPPTGSGGPAPACTVTSASAVPSTVVEAGGDLPPITFLVTVSDAASCGTPLLAFPAEAAYSGVQPMQLVSGNAFELTMPAGQGSWTLGSKTVTASANGGAVTQDITFTVSGSSTCLITATTATPSTVTQSGGTLSAPIVVNATVSSVAVCGTPTLTFPPAAGYATDQTMSSAGGNDFSFTLPVGQGSWPSATYTVVAHANDGATGAASFIVSDAPVCSLSGLVVNPNPAAVKSNGQLKNSMTITVQRSSTTACLAPTVTISAPSGSGTGPMTCSGLTCTRTVNKNDVGWGSAPSTRTVTVSASSASATGTLDLIAG